MQIIVEPRNFEDDPAKQYRVGRHRFIFILVR